MSALENGTSMNCCKRPSIANLDHIKGYAPDHIHMTNRICMNCGKHWYGAETVREYTRKEWDDWVDKAFDDDLAA